MHLPKKSRKEELINGRVSSADKSDTNSRMEMKISFLENEIDSLQKDREAIKHADSNRS